MKVVSIAVNDFHFVINCLEINRVTLFRVKYRGLVFLKVLKDDSVDSEEKMKKLQILEVKLNRTHLGLRVQLL